MQALLDENPAQSTSEFVRELNVNRTQQLLNVYMVQEKFEKVNGFLHELSKLAIQNQKGRGKKIKEKIRRKVQKVHVKGTDMLHRL